VIPVRPLSMQKSVKVAAILIFVIRESEKCNIGNYFHKINKK
jgi:hypothetical protein